MSSFKFSPDAAPPAQLYTDIQLLNQLSDAQLSQLVTLVLNLLSGKATEGAAEAFAAEHGAGFKTVSALIQALLTIITEGMKRALKRGDIEADLKELGLEADKAAAAATLYAAEFAAVSAAVTSSTFKVSQLIDMEWRFGLTAGTSELSELGACYLQLKLLIDRNGSRESVLLELTLPQFYAFVSAMQKAAGEIGIA